MKRVILLSDLVGKLTQSRSMGPYVLGTFLEQSGYDVIIIDWFTRKTNFLEYLSGFLTRDTIAVGISTTFLASYTRDSDGKLLSRTQLLRKYEEKDCLWFDTGAELGDWLNSLRSMLNQYNQDCKIILGGRKSDMLFKLPESDYIKNTYKEIDLAFVRYSETTLVSVLNDLTGNPSTPNYYTETKNNITFVLNKHLIDFCPVTNYNPAWTIMPGEGLPLEVARGCAFNCKFCYYDKKRSYRKPTSNLYDELLRNYDLFGTTSYLFRDDCFNDNREKVMEVCKTILSLPFKIRWVSYARVDLAIKFPETLDIMVESGGSGFCWGIESFNYEAMRAAGKGVHPDKVKDFLTTTYNKYRNDCMYHATFIVGLPGETVETQLETVDWFNKNKCLDSATWGMLDFSDQDVALDEITRDLPEFVTDPERFGYSRMGANYWEHSTMNSEVAYDLCNRVNESYLEGGGSNFAVMWMVPRLMSYGMSWNEIRSVADSKESMRQFGWQILDKESAWLDNYFKKLIDSRG